MKPELSASNEELIEKFYGLREPQDIAKLLEIDYSRLIYHLFQVPDDEKYKVFFIRKKAGGYRKISAPATSLRIIQQKLNRVLQLVYKPSEHVHGFALSRSIVSNARYHSERKILGVLNIDLADFFPSINFGRVYGLFRAKPFCFDKKVITILANICCFQNQLPQGAPTSPVISNMICSRLDEELGTLSKEYSIRYSRYADDISFSTSEEFFPEVLIKNQNYGKIELGERLRRIIYSNGFQINPKKVRLGTKNRRLEVTGLTINKFPNVRRDFIKSVRAMLHAWEKFGYLAAQEEFYKLDTKCRNMWEKYPKFANVAKGKIEFIGMVRGKDDRIYTTLWKQYKLLSIRDKKEIYSDISYPITKVVTDEQVNVQVDEVENDIERYDYLEDIFEETGNDNEARIQIRKGIILEDNILDPESSKEKKSTPAEINNITDKDIPSQITINNNEPDKSQNVDSYRQPEGFVTASGLLSNRFILHLNKIDKKRYTITVFKSPLDLGEAVETVKLPFTEEQLSIVLKVISVPRIDISKFSQREINCLSELKLIRNGSVDVHRKEIIGERIFNSIFVGDILKILYQSLNQFRFSKKAINVELRFSSNNVSLMRIPWELMYDDQPLLINGVISLSRYITNPGVLPNFHLPNELRILFVESRPQGLPPLQDNFEFQVLQSELKELIEKKKVILKKLQPPSFSKLESYIEEFKPNILHFDGHGGFVRECPNCSTFNSVRRNLCRNGQCQCDLRNEIPYSCLAFMDEDSGNVMWIKSDQFSSILARSDIKIAILSSCRSGQTFGETVYSSVGPALIHTGIPVVIAMQLPIYAENAKLFVHGLYHGLANSQSIPEAVFNGRRKIFSKPAAEWFVPILLWRSL